MQRSLTTVTMATVANFKAPQPSPKVTPPDPPDPPDPLTTNPGSVECGYTSDPMAEICYQPTSVEAGCPPPPATSVEAGCPKFTSTTGCDFTENAYCGLNTYPVACSQTVQANQCEGYTQGQSNCLSTSEQACPFTYRLGGNCTTSSDWCNNATMGAAHPACNTKAAGTGCDTRTYNVSCITTFGGNDCTVAGACLATYGINCQQTSTGGFNLCGDKTAGYGSSSLACRGEPGEPSERFLFAGLIGMSVFALRGRFGI